MHKFETECDSITENNIKHRPSFISNVLNNETNFELFNTENKMIKCLKNMDSMLKTMLKQKNRKKSEENKELKWVYAAKVIDKLFFYLSIIYFIITFSLFVLSIKNFYKPT